MALSTLCEEEDPRVGAWVVRELGRKDHSPSWRAHLIDAAELLRIEDEAQRARLRDALKLQIEALLDEGVEGPVLWAAVRRYGTLIAATETDLLCRLLAPERPIATRQVALQTLEQLFLLPGTQAEAVTPRLRDAVVAPLSEALAKEPASRSPEQDALLLNALSVCTALGDERAIEGGRRLGEQAADLFHRLVRRRIHAVLEALRLRSQEGSTHAERALPHAEATLMALGQR